MGYRRSTSSNANNNNSNNNNRYSRNSFLGDDDADYVSRLGVVVQVWS